jgi:hypothetical protein
MKDCRANIARGLFLLSVICGTSLHQRHANAVPASFLQQPSAQQADVKWARLENERFIVYYDASQPKLAEHALKSAEMAYPEFSLLLGTHLSGQPNLTGLPLDQAIESRFEKIPIIVSSRSDGASFANFVPQTLEIQSTLRPPAALFQHELAHRMMYEHIDLKVGPAGRTFMLAMLPTWWTEGLPEYLTESLGRLETEGYIRAMVLNDSFLSWDRLHALYKSTGDVSARGYALSGRFFKYFLERTPEKDLFSLHQGLKYRQLIPPFFSGAYLLIKSLTGQWPGELYESFKEDTRKSVLSDLGDMPRVRKLSGSIRVFDSFGNGSFVVQNESILIPDFSTESRPGGLQIFKFKNNQFSEISQTQLRPLSLKAQDRIYAHAKEIENGGFWTTSLIKNPNRTVGHVVSYQHVEGPLSAVSDDTLKKRIDITLGGKGRAPLVRSILPLAPRAAAVLSTNNTATQLHVVDAKNKRATFMNQWFTPDLVQLVKIHDTFPQTEERSCPFVIVNSDFEKTSLQQVCEKSSPKTIIPSGKFVIQDALIMAPDDFLLLVGWHNIQALVRWTQGEVELLGGVPEWINEIHSGAEKDRVLLSLYTGGNNELLSVSLENLRSSHREWSAKLTENSKWLSQPKYEPYMPPFARYAAQRRNALHKKLDIELSREDLAPKEKQATWYASMNEVPPGGRPESETAQKNTEPKTTATTTATTATIPAPYRFKHWMTYPNYTPSFLAGVTSLGLFSRPFVDEMERFYVQLFGSYVWDDSLVSDERWGLEANIVGNRQFDGWKSNLFLRPRLNGIAYYCRQSRTSPVTVCPDNRPSSTARFTYLREYGADFELNRRIDSIEDAALRYRARFFKISPSASNVQVPDAPLGAQDAVLGAVGASFENTLWQKVFFDAPITDLNKRDIYARGSVRTTIDTTHGLNQAKTGSGDPTNRVNYQNYSLELSHNLSYRGHSFGLRNFYASTGGGTPLNMRELFKPFKTYLIGANDGLQDISTSIAGANLLSYIDFGRVQYRNSVNYTFPIVRSLDTRFGPAFLERLEGELVLSRGGISDNYNLRRTESITTLTGSMRLNIDVKGYQFYPAILYGKAIDKPLWELFTQIRFDQFW